MADTATVAAAPVVTATAAAVITKALAPKKQLPKRELPRAHTVIKSRTIFPEEPIKHVAIEYKTPEIQEDSGVARAIAAAEAQLNGNLARYSPPNPYPKKVDQYGQPYYRAWHNEPMWGYPGEDRLMVLLEFQKPNLDDGLNELPRAPVYMTVADVNAHMADKDARWKEVPTALKFGAHLLFVEDEKLRAMRIMTEHRAELAARAEAAAKGKTTVKAVKPMQRKGTFRIIWRRTVADTAGYDRFMAGFSGARLMERQWADW
jgi:hypothetical protein